MQIPITDVQLGVRKNIESDAAHQGERQIIILGALPPIPILGEGGTTQRILVLDARVRNIVILNVCRRCARMTEAHADTSANVWRRDPPSSDIHVSISKNRVAIQRCCERRGT